MAFTFPFYFINKFPIFYIIISKLETKKEKNEESKLADEDRIVPCKFPPHNLIYKVIPKPPYTRILIILSKK